MSTPPYEIYRSMMLEIKVRIRTVEECLKEYEELIPPLQIEICFLQFRKIIELISFASIVCDQERYKDFREIEGVTSEGNGGDYKKDWNARRILSAMEDINPLFMPRPISGTYKNGEIHHLEGTDLTLTPKKLIKMFKKCSSYLHIPKPFLEEYEVHVQKQKNMYNSSMNTINSYLKYFKKLLWVHVAIGLDYDSDEDKLKSLELDNPRNAWIIDFGDMNDNSLNIIVGVG